MDLAKANTLAEKKLIRNCKGEYAIGKDEYARVPYA